DRIARVTRDGQDIGAASLEPEILASAGDRPGEDHRPVRLRDVPFSLLQAVLAAEDHRFFDHRGIDLRGLLRAAWVNLRSGRVAQGGSTITQQLVKNRLLDPKRTLRRKLDEAWLATLIEWRYSKERILEAYLNDVYLVQRGASPCAYRPPWRRRRPRPTLPITCARSSRRASAAARSTDATCGCSPRSISRSSAWQRARSSAAWRAWKPSGRGCAARTTPI